MIPFGMLQQQNLGVPLSTLNNGLVSWHRMEEAQGSDRLDSALLHPLVERISYPCTQVAGIDAAKYAAGFPSASEVLTSDSADYALQGADFTIALNLYMTSWPSNDGMFGRNIGTVGESAYYLYTHAVNGLSMVMQNNAGTYVEAQIGGLSISQWYRVVCMWDQSAMTTTIIVDDGTPVVSPVLGGTVSADSNTEPLCVGAYQDASSVGMRGYQDNFAVWDRILTAAEVTEYQTLTDQPDVSTLIDGLTSWYAMEEASGDRVDSRSGYDLVPFVANPNRAGIVGNAVDLEGGSNDYLQVATAGVHGIAGDWSAACWIEFDALPTYSTPFGMVSGGNPGASWEYALFTVGTVMHWYVMSGGAYPSVNVNVTTGVTYCVYVEYNATTGELGMSVDDGTLATIAVGTPNNAGVRKLMVGAWENLGRFANGMLDELAIWQDRLLTVDERTEYFSGVTFTNTIHQPEIALPTSGLLMELDGAVPGSFWANDGKTINSSEGGVVAVWEDQSGNGNDWIQTNNSYRPLAHLSANRLYNNGGGTGAIDKHLTGPNISAWTGGSFFARVQNIGGPQGSMWGTTSWNSTGSVGHWAYTGDDGSHYVCFGATARPLAFAWSTPAESSLDLMNYEENIATDGTMQCYINGIQQYSAYASTPAFRTVPYLGCGVRSNGPQFSTGSYFYKVCAYDRVVTNVERTRILAWLNA